MAIKRKRAESIYFVFTRTPMLFAVLTLDIMISVVMLHVIMLNVIMSSVVAPIFDHHSRVLPFTF